MRALVATSMVAASAAFAWPADVYVDLEVGRESFQRPSSIAWIEVEDPKIATAELLESGEILFTGVSAGRTLALLYAEGKMAVWRVRVAAKGEKSKPASGADALAAAQKACPGLAVSGEGDLTGNVKDERCRQALLALLQTDQFDARHLDLTFEVAALQSQLASLKLPKALTAKYSGAGLVLEGTAANEREHRSALWTVFKASVGRVALDDRIELQP